MLRRLASLSISAAFAGLWKFSANGTDQGTVLYYHGVKRHEAARFARQMIWLKSNFRVLPLRALLSGSWSGRCACVTFDDGLDNVRQYALPILRELELPATMFVVSGNLGRRPCWVMPDRHPDRDEVLSTAEQLEEYPADLMEIGSHTVTHADLTTLTASRLRSELVDSKKDLEDRLNREVISLSVPFGAYNEQTMQAACAAGYKLVATCDPQLLVQRSTLVRVGRFKVAPQDWELEFRLAANGHQRWRCAWQSLRRSAFRNSTPINETVGEGKAGLFD